jgi:hypothetical protein
MNVAPIRRMVTGRKRQQSTDVRLRQRIVEVAQAQGVVLNETAVQEFINLLDAYVQQAPDILEACAVAAANAGIGSVLAPLLQTAADYYLHHEDLIPDHEGLYGLLDDTYLCIGLLLAASAVYQQHTGIPLLGLHALGAQSVLRSVIGEATGRRLDQVIMSGLHQTQAQIQQLLSWQQTLGLQSSSGTSASWGAAFEDRVAEFGARHGVSLNTSYIPDWGYE